MNIGEFGDDAVPEKKRAYIEGISSPVRGV